MTKAVSKKRAKTLSFALFFVGLAVVSYLKAWWPGIMLVVGIPLALRQYLLDRRYDMWVSLFVFVGVFVTVQFNISWEVLLPVLFAVGGIYTQVNSQVGFWQRRTAIDFEVVSIAQLIQVELLRQSASLLQTQGASLPKFQLSNSLGYIFSLENL